MIKLCIGVILLFISLLCSLQWKIEWKKAVGAKPSMTMGEMMEHKTVTWYFKLIAWTVLPGIILTIWGVVDLIFY